MTPWRRHIATAVRAVVVPGWLRRCEALRIRHASDNELHVKTQRLSALMLVDQSSHGNCSTSSNVQGTADSLSPPNVLTKLRTNSRRSGW